MARTVRDMLTGALRTSGLLAAGESPSPEDIQDAYVYAEQILEQWGLSTLMVPAAGPLSMGAIDSAVAFPSGYEIALRMTLAMYMREEAGLQPSRLIAAGVDQAIAAIKHGNAINRKPADMTIDPSLLSSDIDAESYQDDDMEE